MISNGEPVTRYGAGLNGTAFMGMLEVPAGDYVRYADYDALAQRLEACEGALNEARQHVWGLYLGDLVTSKDQFSGLLDRIDAALQPPAPGAGKED